MGEGAGFVGGWMMAAAFAVLVPSAGVAQTVAESALSDAAAHCRAAEVERLIRSGTQVNGVNSGGYTPLMRAAGEGCADVVRLLLGAGADPSIRHPSFGDAADQARLHRQAAVESMIRAAAAPSSSGPAGAAARTDAPVAPAANDVRGAAAGSGAREWPRIGAYRVGERVLYSGDGGKNWRPAVIRAVDPTYGYSFVDGPSGSYSNYFVVAPRREPFWTSYFVGDWRISVPMAMGTVTDGRNVYRTVSGGMRLPPLRISADGTYAWRVQQGSGERVVRGRWDPNPDGPGVILRNAERGADWLVYNNSDALSSLGETVILSSECCTHYDGSRLN